MFLEYMVLLVVVTFNVGLIVSVTLGYALGVLAFGARPAAAFLARRLLWQLLARRADSALS